MASSEKILFDITEGWTAEIGPQTALADGQPFSLAGFTCELVVRDKSGTQVGAPGTVRLHANQVTNPGQWYFTPDPTKWLNTGTPYKAHLKITDGAGEVMSCPNGAPDIIRVFKL